MRHQYDEYLTPIQLVDWAKANLNIIKLNQDLTDQEIARLMRWVGMCTYDTIFMDGDKPRIGRIGIGNILSLTLIVFPKFYEEKGLSQYN
jgi:hypothetical protein